MVFSYLDLTSNEKEKANPVQVKSGKKISDLESQSSSLIIARDSGLSTITRKQLDTVKGSIRKEKTNLDNIKKAN